METCILEVCISPRRRAAKRILTERSRSLVGVKFPKTASLSAELHPVEDGLHSLSVCQVHLWIPGPMEPLGQTLDYTFPCQFFIDFFHLILGLQGCLCGVDSGGVMLTIRRTTPLCKRKLMQYCAASSLLALGCAFSSSTTSSLSGLGVRAFWAFFKAFAGWTFCDVSSQRTLL